MDDREIIIIIGCDVDNDYNPKGNRVHENENIWDGITFGIPNLKEIFNSLTQTRDDPYPNLTWLLRSDKQMDMLYNDYAYPVSHFLDMWRSLNKDGDEIGWHPHMWDWDNIRKQWFPHLDDDKWTNECLEAGYKAISKYFKPTSCRTGWDFQSNNIFEKLVELGIKVDLSGLPGQKQILFQNSPTSHLYDWKPTTEEFYFPSKSDYRISSTSKKCLNILEMPLSLTPIPTLQAYAKFVHHNVRHNLNQPFSKPVIAYNFKLTEIMRITKHPKLFKRGVNKKFKDSKIRNSTEYIITYFHPHELLGNGLFSISNFEANLKCISDMSGKYGIPYRFLTATQAAEDYLTQTHQSEIIHD